MAMWHCPHCGTPQAETARCWVCRRSSTTCSTCRHFRRAVTQAIGYCGLDRSRRPLRGDEIRGCWESRPASVETVAPVRPSPPRARLREFVPLDDAAPAVEPAAPPAPAVATTRPPIDPRDRVTLFDLEA